jgi:hypothetical protein
MRFVDKMCFSYFTLAVIANTITFITNTNTNTIIIIIIALLSSVTVVV